MDIKKCKVMLAVEEYGSFTKVGAELGYTQSGITQMMKALENEVGFPLFVKQSHGVRLTKEAKSLIPSIQALINADEVVNQEIASLKGSKIGTITIGTYLSCSMHWIPKIIYAFQKQYPDIHFRIVEGIEGELADWIEERRVDIGFISADKGHRYTFLPVMEDDLYVVCPLDHPFAKMETIPLEALNGESFIITEYSPGNEVHRILKQYKIKPNIKYTTINEFSSLSMVETGLGITVLPGLLLRGRSGQFVLKPIEPHVYRKLGLAYTHTEDLSPATSAFLEYAKQFLLDD